MPVILLVGRGQLLALLADARCADWVSNIITRLGDNGFECCQAKIVDHHFQNHPLAPDNILNQGLSKPRAYHISSASQDISCRLIGLLELLLVG